MEGLCNICDNIGEKECNACSGEYYLFESSLLEFIWTSMRQRQRPWLGDDNDLEYVSGTYRNYYGPKEVLEWRLYDLPIKNKFWDLWRNDDAKEALKSLGFGVFKTTGWILFWEVDYLNKLKEAIRQIK
jgi:hypothetical protein